mgnify:CR=1 FL=1
MLFLEVDLFGNKVGRPFDYLLVKIADVNGDNPKAGDNKAYEKSVKNNKDDCWREKS